MSNLSLPALIYDNECPLCTRFAKGILYFDQSKKINLLPVTDQNVYELFPQLSYEECQETVHLIDQDGRIHTGKDVINFLIKTMPEVSKLSWLLEKEAMQNGLDVFYQTLDSLRKKMKKHCTKCPQKKSEIKIRSDYE